MTAAGGLADRFRAARRDPDLVVLEGFHALKHALRFGATILEAVTSDRGRAVALAEALAPDLASRLPALLEPVPASLFAELAPRPPETGILALARRPAVATADLERASATPLLLLERPTHPRNLGAAIRVAAAAGAGGVLSLGELDPWHPTAVRAAAGLQFALPVLRLAVLPDTDRPLYAFDPGGTLLDPARLPPAAILAFGSERRGLTRALRARAEACFRLPMRDGVSSLNLATAVAAVLYLHRLGTGRETEAGAWR